MLYLTIIFLVVISLHIICSDSNLSMIINSSWEFGARKWPHRCRRDHHVQVVLYHSKGHDILDV